MIQQYYQRYYISLNTINKRLKKNSAWIKKVLKLDDGVSLYLNESRKKISYYCLETVTSGLVAACLLGDRLSYQMLIELKSEIIEKNLEMPVELKEIELLDIKRYLIIWVNQLDKPIDIERDKAREQFIEWTKENYHIHFSINRVYFNRHLKDIKQCKIVTRTIDRKSFRVFRFDNSNELTYNG